MTLYAAYDLFWLTGATFSYGKNDTLREPSFFLLTFPADVPAFVISARRLRLGLPLFCKVLAASLMLAISQNVLNNFTFLYWYAPKLLPLSAALTAKLNLRMELTQ